MDDLLTDQQQAEIVRSWLRDNALWLAAGVVLGLGGLFGWNQWQKHEVAKAGEASAVFGELLKAVDQRRLDDARTKMTELESAYASTPYADQGRLAMARAYVEQGKPEDAVNALRQVVDGRSAIEMRNIARLRLARLLSSLQKHDEALKVLEVNVPPSVAPAFHEARGDAYFWMGKLAEARSEYEQALNGERSAVINRGLVQAKLDDLGGPAVAAPPASAGAPAPSPAP